MAIRRRDQIPPYEIMRNRGSNAPGVGAANETSEPAVSEKNAPETQPLPNTSSNGGRTPWWVGSSSPIILRIPRGLAIAIVLGLFGLLILSYWVGTARGKSAAIARAQENGVSVDASAPRRVAPAISREPEETAARGGNGQSQSNNEPIRDERRKPGQNYLRLQTGEYDEGKRLSEFMADKGVTIQLYETREGAFIVYAVDRGFRADELNSEACLAYKRKLMDLGRAWKRFNNNRGTDLGTMYYELYSG